MSSRLIVNIDVPNLEAGITFYRDGLQFGLVRKLFDGAVAEMTLDGETIFLIENENGSKAVSTMDIRRDYNDHWTPIHLDIAVDSLENATARAINAGAKQTKPPSKQVFGKIAPMRDPFGHGFCLIEFSAEGYSAAES